MSFNQERSLRLACKGCLDRELSMLWALETSAGFEARIYDLVDCVTRIIKCSFLSHCFAIIAVGVSPFSPQLIFMQGDPQCVPQVP